MINSVIQTEKIMRVAFLTSGSGGSLKFIHQVALRLGLPLVVSAVLADRECGALDYARAVGLPHALVRYTRQAPAALQQALRDAAPDVVVTNIHKIIDAETIGLLPGCFINLHYSLLPAFKGFIGMETVEQARLLNVTILGATCHEVDELVDNGRCLAQFAIGVNWAFDSTPRIYDLVFRGAGMVLLQSLLNRIGYSSATSLAAVNTEGQVMLFAPPLTFAAEALDEGFWQQVKTA